MLRPELQRCSHPIRCSAPCLKPLTPVGNATWCSRIFTTNYIHVFSEFCLFHFKKQGIEKCWSGCGVGEFGIIILLAKTPWQILLGCGWVLWVDFVFQKLCHLVEIYSRTCTHDTLDTFVSVFLVFQTLNLRENTIFIRKEKSQNCVNSKIPEL